MENITKNREYPSLLVGIIAIFLWSTSSALTRTLSEQAGTFTSASYAYLISGLIGTLLILPKKKRRERLLLLPKKYIFSCGGLFVLYNVTIYVAIGIAHNRAQVLGIALVNYLWPFLILIFSFLIIEQRIKIYYLMLGAICALSGAYFAIVHGTGVSFSDFSQEIQTNITAYLMAFGAAISWGLYTVLNESWEKKYEVEDGYLIVAPVFFISGLIMFCLSIFTNEESLWSLQVILELFYFALFPLLLAHIMWTYVSQKKVIYSLSVVSMFLPLMTTVFNCIYFNN